MEALEICICVCVGYCMPKCLWFVTSWVFGFLQLGLLFRLFFLGLHHQQILETHGVNGKRVNPGDTYPWVASGDVGISF